METHRKSERVEAVKLQPSRFLSIRTDRKPKAKFLFCIPLNITEIRGVASLTTGLHTTDLLATLALTVCLSLDFIEPRHLNEDEGTLTAVVCAMFFAPLATRVLVNLAAVTASYVLLMKEEKRRAKDIYTFVAGLLDRLKIWLIIIVILQAIQLVAAVVVAEALNARILTLVVTVTERQVVYYLLVALHVVSTAFSVALTYYFWRCGLYYYLAIAGFYDDEPKIWIKGSSPEASEPHGETSAGTRHDVRRSRTSSWNDYIETETQPLPETKGNHGRRISRVSTNEHLSRRTSTNVSNSSNYHLENETDRQPS